MNEEQLRAIMPGANDARRRELLPFLQAAMTEFGIDRPAREAAFIAQLAHESGQFKFMEEIWGPTDAQRRYEPTSTLATTLGNMQAGDGKLFKGRGPIQITGRANYQRFGNLLGLDLIADPPRAAKPEVAFRIAGLFWSKKGLNELADRATPDGFREITRRINGGFNGLADRQKFYDAACRVLGVSDAPRSIGGGWTTAPHNPESATRPDAAPRSVDGGEEEPAFTRGFEAISAEPAPRKKAAKKQPGVRNGTGAKKRAAKKQAAAKRPGAAKKSAGGKRKAAAKKTATRRTAARKPAARKGGTARRVAKRSGARTKKR